MRVQGLVLNRGYEYRERIDHHGSGLPVLTYLSGSYRHSSKEEWENRLKLGEVFLDGIAARADTILRSGQMLVWRRSPWDEPDVPFVYAVLYEDQHLLGVAKPCGLPTVPGGGFLEHTLLQLVRKSYPEATPIHRLGRGTSGVVLFARSKEARSFLCADMRQRRMTKVYRALAGGTPLLDHFSIETPIGPVPHPLLGTIHAACSTGKRALSRVRILERRTDASLLEVIIETGRPHQIRIHLAAAGYPLVGDPLYAAGGGLRSGEAVLPGAIGYQLHAERLCLRHPSTESFFEISCCPPPELRTVSAAAFDETKSLWR
jgi:23S rRNA pseudouridine1911/1915/1917 synthase